MPAALVLIAVFSLALSLLIWLVALASGVALNFFILYVVVLLVVVLLIKVMG